MVCCFVRQECGRALDVAEKLKKELIVKYEGWYNAQLLKKQNSQRKVPNLSEANQDVVSDNDAGKSEFESQYAINAEMQKEQTFLQDNQTGKAPEFAVQPHVPANNASILTADDVAAALTAAALATSTISSTLAQSSSTEVDAASLAFAASNNETCSITVDSQLTSLSLSSSPATAVDNAISEILSFPSTEPSAPQCDALDLLTSSSCAMATSAVPDNSAEVHSHSVSESLSHLESSSACSDNIDASSHSCSTHPAHANFDNLRLQSSALPSINQSCSSLPLSSSYASNSVSKLSSSSSSSLYPAVVPTVAAAVDSAISRSIPVHYNSSGIPSSFQPSYVPVMGQPVIQHSIPTQQSYNNAVSRSISPQYHATSAVVQPPLSYSTHPQRVMPAPYTAADQFPPRPQSAMVPYASQSAYTPSHPTAPAQSRPGTAIGYQSNSRPGSANAFPQPSAPSPTPTPRQAGANNMSAAGAVIPRPPSVTALSAASSPFEFGKNIQVDKLRQLYVSLTLWTAAIVASVILFHSICVCFVMQLPIKVLTEFYRYAAQNTLSNIETCAILTGNIKNNAFYITHVILPKQTATSDTCVTQDEEKLIEIQSTSNLLTLGW